MANTNNPRGLIPVGTVSGRPFQASKRTYTVFTDAVIGKGDLLVLLDKGTYSAVAAAGDSSLGLTAANSAGKILGVAAETVMLGATSSATAGTQIHVYDDPDIIFSIQADAALNSGHIGQCFDVNDIANATRVPSYDVAGGSTSGISIQTLDVATLATTANLQVRGLSAIQPMESANDWGTYNKVDVTINESLWRGATTGQTDA